MRRKDSTTLNMGRANRELSIVAQTTLERPTARLIRLQNNHRNNCHDPHAPPACPIWPADRPQRHGRPGSWRAGPAPAGCWPPDAGLLNNGAWCPGLCPCPWYLPRDSHGGCDRRRDPADRNRGHRRGGGGQGVAPVLAAHGRGEPVCTGTGGVNAKLLDGMTLKACPDK